MFNPKLDYKLMYNPMKKYITPFFCKYNIHPNYVTIFAMLLNIVLYYKLKNYYNYNFNLKNDKIFIIILIYIMCFFDCLDGSIARNCNKHSELGGFLDITNDNIRWAILISFGILKYFNYKVFNFYFIYIIFTILFLFEYMCEFDFSSHKSQSDILNIGRDNSIFIYFIITLLI